MGEASRTFQPNLDSDEGMYAGAIHKSYTCVQSLMREWVQDLHGSIPRRQQHLDRRRNPLSGVYDHQRGRCGREGNRPRRQHELRAHEVRSIMRNKAFAL